MKEKKPSVKMKLSLEAELERVTLEMIETCRRIDELYQRDELFSEKAIVILENKEQKRRLLEEFKSADMELKERHFYWMADRVTLESAPEPR